MIYVILALRLELVRAYHAAENYLLVIVSVILVRHFQHQGQRISASIDIGGAA